MRREQHRTHRNVQSWTDLSDLKDIHSGSKCFVIGAGPSAAFLDLNEIDHHVVISVNSSILLLKWDVEISGFPPITNRYWISNDRLCCKWDYFWKNVLRAKCSKIVRTSWKPFEDKIIDYGFRYFKPRKSEKMPLLEDDGGLCSTSSIPTAIDLAIYMGCKQIYLIGVDQCMVHGNSHFWQFWNTSKWPRRSDKGKKFRPEQKHQMRIFNQNISVFKALNEYAACHSSVIKNCSNCTKLRVFDKISLDGAMKE